MFTFMICHIRINLLNPKESSGPDWIAAKMLKLCPEIFDHNLEKIDIESIDKGEYPSEMKLAPKGCQNWPW